MVLAIPLHKFATLDPALLAGKLVVDAMNYWPPVDGVQEMFEDSQYGSSEIVQHRLARSTVVKTLNHIGYHEIEDERRPAARRSAARSGSPATIRPRWTWWRTHRAHRLRRRPVRQSERGPPPRTRRPRLRRVAAPGRVRAGRSAPKPHRAAAAH